jgi:hypothetical protein
MRVTRSAGERLRSPRAHQCGRAQLGPDEFLVTGVDSSVSFHLPGKLPWMRSEIIARGRMRTAPGKCSNCGKGDETDRGLTFHDKPEVEGFGWGAVSLNGHPSE